MRVSRRLRDAEKRETTYVRREFLYGNGVILWNSNYWDWYWEYLEDESIKFHPEFVRYSP